MSARCYDQDGNENPDLLACSPNGKGLASCCQPGDACATNGFCLPPSAAKAPLKYYVYGCSDPSWNVSTCVNECDCTMLTQPDGKAANTDISSNRDRRHTVRRVQVLLLSRRRMRLQQLKCRVFTQPSSHRHNPASLDGLVSGCIDNAAGPIFAVTR